MGIDAFKIEIDVISVIVYLMILMIKYLPSLLTLYRRVMEFSDSRTGSEYMLFPAIG